jgi:hypothetical protein
MKSVIKYVVIVFAFCAVGCSSLGQLDMSSGQVSVFTGEEIKADLRKREALQEDHGVELLHDYVLHYVNRNRMRKSLKLEITITTLRISFGRDHMSAETVLIENGKEIERFTSVSTSISGNINKFAKDLSKKIVTRARTF